MPLYEYHCQECDQLFEKLVPFSEADRNPPCPGCHSTQTERKISKVAAFGASLNPGSSAVSTSCSPRGGFS